MTSHDDEGTPPMSQSPQLELSESTISLPRIRSPEKAADRSTRLVSDLNLPFRRSNPSLTAIFATTSGSAPASRSSSFINTGTPPIPQIGQSIFSPGPQERVISPQSTNNRDVILRSFVPHVAVYPSQDVEDLLAQKGYSGGLLQLIRPYGETVQGKVTIRDNTGSSKSWEDYGIRFTKLKDGLDGPRMADRKSTDIRPSSVDVVDRYFPASSARLRTGGDIPYIEDTIGKHISYAESQAPPAVEDYLTHGMTAEPTSPHASPFHLLYLRRLLSGIPVTPHETLSHPVACVIAISSRHPNPIEELRQMYANTTAGDQRLPQWVNPEYLRYYVLVHDEDHDDSQRSTSLFDQMKRHFGLHCHLLRIRSEQCVPSDDDCVRAPICEWLSAAEELSEIQKQGTFMHRFQTKRATLTTVESHETAEDPGPWLFDSDAASIRNFVREMVTQSIVPVMERLRDQWNDQIASRRRGLTGRFNSIAKKWSPFGSSRNASSPLGNPNNPNSNYDSLQGFYRPDAPEAIMRKLADYAFMLRDFRLAQSTYELLRTDYSNDKAWKYYAGANEMAAVTMLLNPSGLPAKIRAETVDQLLEAASYSYLARSLSPYYCLRTLAVAVELLMLQGGSGADDAARWACRITELDLTGPLGHALFAERVAAAYASRQGTGSKQWGARKRKSALWSVFATEAWLNLDRPRQAEKNLQEVFKKYDLNAKETEAFGFQGMRIMLADLADTVDMKKGDSEPFPSLDSVLARKLGHLEVAGEEPTMEKLDARPHRRSSNLAAGVSTITDPLGVGPMPAERAGRVEDDDAQEEKLS